MSSDARCRPISPTACATSPPRVRSIPNASVSWGASYGGYAALAGATIDTGVYRCAVSMAGISDLKRVIDWSADDEHGGALSKRYWLRFMGVESPGVAKLDEISPIKRVDKVTIPVLLIHGKDDTVVNIAQSQVMYDALKRQGKDVELVVLPHENHHLLTGATLSPDASGDDGLPSKVQSGRVSAARVRHSASSVADLDTQP